MKPEEKRRATIAVGVVLAAVGVLWLLDRQRKQAGSDRQKTSSDQSGH